MNKAQLAAPLLAALILILSLAQYTALASDRWQEGYPPPLLPTPTLAVPVEVPVDPNPDAYPAGGTDFDGQIPVPIGIESGAQPMEDSLSNESAVPLMGDEAASDRGIVFLWLGFLATLLVFLTSVFGSIVLFTRRNES